MVRVEQHSIEQSVSVAAPPETVWREVTQVDIAAFRHPALFSILGIPKPLRAEVLRPGVGGERIAFFSNNLRFTQKITEWRPPERYAFTFAADPGFRVVFCFDLSDGPFRMLSGAYLIRPTERGAQLSLSSQYELRGLVGACIGLPVRLILRLFQAYLLRGIRINAERRAQARR